MQTSRVGASMIILLNGQTDDQVINNAEITNSWNSNSPLLITK